ncbi:LuxR family transcriptional regulator [soil metagenome]
MRIRSPVFVGRQSEMGHLSSLLDDAVAGRPRVVVIGGEAGVGKSRLVEEFGTTATERDARWLIGAAADYGAGGLPFGALVEALRPTGEALFLLNDTMPTDGVATDAAARQQVFERLLDLLVGLSTKEPVVLVLEDIHWADASTREFLAFVARNRSTARVLVVATYRTEEVPRDHPLHRYLLELQRGQADVLLLSRFGRDEVRDQVNAIRGGAIDDRFVDALYERSQGNAFFSEELLASAVGDELGGPLPPTLRDTMLARVERLSAPARAVVAAAAVAGTADEGLLAEITGLQEDPLAASLREAIERGVIEPIDGDRYGFRHALLRDAVYQQMLAGERARTHRRIAVALSAHAEDDAQDAGVLGQLAHHWELAGQPREAFVAAWRAAVAADRIYAKPEASRLFERAADLWSSVPDAADLLRAELDAKGEPATPADRATVAQLAALSAASFDLPLGARLGRRALDYLDESTNPDRVGLIANRVVIWSRMGGSAELADEADDRLGQLWHLLSPEVRAQILLGDSDWAIVLGDFRRARANADEALAAAAQVGHGAQMLAAMIIAGRATGYYARPEEAAELFDRVRAEAKVAGMPFYAADADRWQGDLYQAAGKFDDAVRLLRSAAAQLDALGEAALGEHALLIAGQALHRQGRWAEAMAELRPHRHGIHWAGVLWSYLLAGRGEFAEAEAELERVAEFVLLYPNTGSLGPYYATIAEIALWRGQPADTLATVTRALDPIANDLRWVGDLTMLGLRAAADLGPAARSAADQIFDNLQTRARRGLETGTIFATETNAALRSAEAEMKRVGGELDASAYGTAAEAWLAIPEPYPAAYALYRQAEASIANDRAAARVALERAREITIQLDAQPLRDAIEMLARRARIDLGTPSPLTTADAFGLTPREREVLALLARGRSDREIAGALFISPKTASVHVTNIKGKLGVERRIEAAAIGLQLGLDE